MRLNITQAAIVMSYRHHRCDGAICRPWPRRCMLAIVVLGCDMMTEEEERVPPSSGAARLEAEEAPNVRHALVRSRMTRASEDDSARFTDDIGDDTIELALTEEDMLALSRAAEEEQAKTSTGRSAPIVTGAYLRDQSVRSRRWLQIIASSVLGIVISVALGVVAHRISMVTITAPSGAEQSAESLDSIVRFSNPFDASEVFEFPPGTSDEQARQSVAAILLQRAHDRQVADAVKSNPAMPGAAAHRARVARNSEPRRS